MTRDCFTAISGLSAGVALALAVAASGPPASAQQTPPAADAPASGGNVTSYQPSFFADYRPNTAMDMVNRLPGFSFDGGSGARGFSGTAGNVLIDGERPPSRSDDLYSVVARIPASSVLRIDVIRGGAPGIDMQGKAIVANVIRKPDGGLTGSVSGGVNYATNADPSVNAAVQAQLKKGGSLLEGGLSYYDNHNAADESRTRVDPTGATILRGAGGYASDNSGLQGSGSWETTVLGGKLRLNGLLNSSTSYFDDVETQTVPAAGTQQSTSDNDHTNGEVGVRYSHSVGDGMTLDLVGFQSWTEDDATSIFNTPSLTSGSASDSKGGESIATATLHFKPFGEFKIEAGAEAVYNFQNTTNARILNGQAFPLPGDDFDANELRGEGFGTLTWTPSKTLNAELGARYEWSRIEASGSAGDSEKTLGYFKPRLNISWTPWTGHQFGFRVERIVNQLSFGGFASSASFDTQVFGIGNPAIEPDKQWIVDARYERQLGGQSNFIAEYIHTQIDDINGRAVVPVVDPATGIIVLFEITKNVGTAYRDALTLSGSYELDKFGMKGGLINFSTTLRDSSAIDPVTFVGRKLSNDIPYSWNFNIQQTLAGGNFRWALFLEDDDDSYGYSPRSITKNVYTMFIGANITWKPAPGWTFSAGVNNIGAPSSHYGQLFFDLPRNIGRPLYYEQHFTSGTRTYFANLRRNF